MNNEQASLNDVINLTGMWQGFQRKWSKSFIPILMLCLGFGAGQLTLEWSIIDDCKYLNVFRFGTQSFECTRKN